MRTADIADGKLIIDDNGKKFIFEAHGEEPPPSMLGWGLSAGGRHWSDRDPNVKLEKHTAVEDIAFGENMVAWFTQELIPNGADYKIGKNSKLYVANLDTLEQKLVYKGECYGDLCFYADELYFNMGNKAAVIDLKSGETKVLFKHSGIKKNMIALKPTPERIFFTHWTKDCDYIMWYDRSADEVVNPHINSFGDYAVWGNKVVYSKYDIVWVLDIVTMKKKMLWGTKQIGRVKETFIELLGISSEEFRVRGFSTITGCDGERIYFIPEVRYSFPGIDLNSPADYTRYLSENDLIGGYMVEFSCDQSGKDIQIAVPRDRLAKFLRPDEGRYYIGGMRETPDNTAFYPFYFKAIDNS